MTKMVRIGAGLLVAGLAFSTFTGSAHAADLGGYERMPSIKDRAPEYRPSIWSGFYIGANIGGGAGTVSSKDASDTIGAGGALGGVHGGYNWQRGNFVFGAEADFDVSGMRGSKTYSDGDVAAHFRNLGSIRGRLGYAFNNLLVYGTAGYGWTNVNLTAADAFAKGSVSNTDGGFVYGGGLEYKLSRNLSVRGEALRFDASGQWPTSNGPSATLNTPATEFRLGVTWHLN